MKHGMVWQMCILSDMYAYLLCHDVIVKDVVVVRGGSREGFEGW